MQSTANFRYIRDGDSMKRRWNIYKNMMNGVTYFLPFVVAGGIFIALAFVFNASQFGSIDFGTNTSIAEWFNSTGTVIMGFILPVLGGYIAYSIADRPGLVPGFVAGALALTGGGGFLGAIFGGFISGYITLGLIKLFSKLPHSWSGLKTMIIFPVFGALFTAVLMIGVNVVITPVTNGLQPFLSGLSGLSAIAIGFIAGAMMAYDMGGPVNKIAYLIGIASIVDGTSSMLMASVMVGGMTPPLGIALATLLFKNKFSLEQKKLGRANWIMGATFMTEGAIPFVTENPKVVLPSIMAGSAVAGALVALFQTTLPIPHGGIFVIVFMHNWWGFVISLIVGMMITAILIKILLPQLEEEIEDTI